jgi:hypothetical protein
LAKTGTPFDMSATIRALFENGVFRPLKTLSSITTSP